VHRSAHLGGANRKRLLAANYQQSGRRNPSPLWNRRRTSFCLGHGERGVWSPVSGSFRGPNATATGVWMTRSAGWAGPCVFIREGKRHGVGFGTVQQFGLRMWRAMLLGYILVWAQRGPIDHGIGPKTGSMSLDLFSSSLSNDSQRLLKKKCLSEKKEEFLKSTLWFQMYVASNDDAISNIMIGLNFFKQYTILYSESYVLLLWKFFFTITLVMSTHAISLCCILTG